MRPKVDLLTSLRSANSRRAWDACAFCAMKGWPRGATRMPVHCVGASGSQLHMVANDMADHVRKNLTQPQRNPKVRGTVLHLASALARAGARVLLIGGAPTTAHSAVDFGAGCAAHATVLLGLRVWQV